MRKQISLNIVRIIVWIRDLGGNGHYSDFAVEDGITGQLVL
ncbi:MAG: hypothetical protein ABSD46_10435 [Bacteroidota bacterium]